MKILTVGWLSVFTYIALINMYIWNTYWKIPFKDPRLIKLAPYIIIHLGLALISIYYFYLFFNGRTDGVKVKKMSYLAAFYLTIIHYAMIFYLVHDLVNLTSKIISYPYYLRYYGGRLFFGGFLIFTLAALISIMGIINSHKLLVKDYSVDLKTSGNKSSEVNLIYLSDIHMGTSVNRDNIDHLVSRIRYLDPDILILGGDIFDEGTSMENKKILARKIGSLKTKYGIFAIEGNHEYKSAGGNIDEEMDYLSDEGIRVLRDDYIEIDSIFYLIGRKDPYEDRLELDEIVSNLNKDIPIILLDHRPGFKEAVNNGRIDLQISGHSHSGQFFPMQILDYFAPKFTGQYVYGHHKIENLHHIVSSGVGNWGIPIRLASRREIVVVRLGLN